MQKTIFKNGFKTYAYPVLKPVKAFIVREILGIGKF